MSYLKTSSGGYVYDRTSSAILNTDEGDWIRYKAERDKHKLINSLESRIHVLEIRIQELEHIIRENMNG